MIRGALQSLKRVFDVMQSMQPVMQFWQLGSHRVPYVSFVLCGFLLYFHTGLKRIDSQTKWLVDSSMSLALLLPMAVAGFSLFILAVLNFRKIALTTDPRLLPGLQVELPAALILQILFTATIVMAIAAVALNGIPEVAFFLLFLLYVSIEDNSTAFRKGLLLITFVVAVLLVAFGAASNLRIFRSVDSWMYRLGFVLAFGSLIVTSLSLVAASIIRPRWGIPIAVFWWLTLWVPNPYVMATREYILRLMYEHFTQTGTHVFTALATSAWVVWLLQNSRTARLQSRGDGKRKWHLMDLRETMVGLSALPYRFQLHRYIRRGTGGISSLFTLCLSPNIHMGTMWTWSLGLTGLMMAIYTFVSPRFFESTGFWLGAQFIIWAGMTTVLLLPRAFFKRQAELKLATLLPGSPNHSDARRILAKTVFFLIPLALAPAILVGWILIQLPVMPEYPTLNLRPPRYDHLDYWLLATLLVVGICANGWRLLAKFDWLNIPELQDWFFTAWFLLIFSSVAVKLTNLGIVPEWKLLVIACNAVAGLWFFYQALYGGDSSRRPASPRLASR